MGDGGGDIDVFREAGVHSLADVAGPMEEEWDAEGGIVAAVLLKAAVVAEAVTVVRGVDDERVVGVAGLLEGGEDAADVAIEIGDGGVIGGGDALFVVLGEVLKDGRDLGGIFRADAGGGAFAGGPGGAVFEGEIEGGVGLLEADPEGEGLVTD